MLLNSPFPGMHNVHSHPDRYADTKGIKDVDCNGVTPEISARVNGSTVSASFRLYGQQSSIQPEADTDRCGANVSDISTFTISKATFSHCLISKKTSFYLVAFVVTIPTPQKAPKSDIPVKSYACLKFSRFSRLVPTPTQTFGSSPTPCLRPKPLVRSYLALHHSNSEPTPNP